VPSALRAAVENLSHSASFHPKDKIAPSKRGTERLVHASLDSIASRTNSAEVRTPSFWRISEEVLATVL
jgi:hypothetical protein